MLQTSNIRSLCRPHLPWTRGVAFTAPAPLLPAVPHSSPGWEPFSVSSASSLTSNERSQFILTQISWLVLSQIWLLKIHNWVDSLEFRTTLTWEQCGRRSRDSSQGNKQSASCLNSLIKMLDAHQCTCNNWSKFLLCIYGRWTFRRRAACCSDSLLWCFNVEKFALNFSRITNQILYKCKVALVLLFN